MSQSAADANAITTQLLISPTNIADMENKANTPFDEPASVITTQPMMNHPIDEEQEKERQQKNDTVRDTIEAVDGCTWCWFSSADCSRNCECSSCGDDDCGDCCTSCCADGPSADVNVDANDCGDCLECCGACFECCSSD